MWGSSRCRRARGPGPTWARTPPASPGSGGTAPRSISTRWAEAAFLSAEVGDIARVRVNDVDCGVLWTAPFRVDVTQALRPGRNVVELDVANAWMNRLIAEAARPTGELFGPVSGVYAADAAPRPSGVLGPVRLELLR